MFNHKILALSSLLLVASLSGCGNETNNKIILTYGDKSLNAYIRLNTEADLLTKVNNEENFILVSYADETCSCWGMFESTVINPYVREYDIPIYVIHTDALLTGYYGLPINSGKTNTPVVGLFENGVYKYGTSYDQNAQVFREYNAFINYIDRYMTKPYVYYVSLAQLNDLMKGDEKFILNWALDICPDCKTFDHGLMKEYLKNHPKEKDVPFYVIETRSEGLRLLDGISNTEHWTAQKNKYGLSDVLNTTYGYSTGFVPTLQVIEPDGTDYVTLGDISPIISDQMVFQNEKVAYDEVNDKYYVSDSYYDGVRATKYLGAYESQIGMEIDESAVYEQNSALRFDPTIRYDIQKGFATSFLDFYWK